MTKKKSKAWRFGLTSSVTGKPIYKLRKVKAYDLKRRLERMADRGEIFYLRKTGTEGKSPLFTVFQRRKKKKK